MRLWKQTRRRINNETEMLNLHNYAGFSKNKSKKTKPHKANLQYFVSIFYVNWNFIIGFVCCCNTLCSIKFWKIKLN